MGSPRRRAPRGPLLCLLAMVAASAAACTGSPLLIEQLEARRLAADLHLAYSNANEAANRAVLADNDAAAAAAAAQARQSEQQAEQHLQNLEPVLRSLGYKDELASLERFKTRWSEFKTLDDEILPLAVENTNLKAQRLSFGAGQEAADAVAAALATDRLGVHTSEVEALTLRAIAAVLRIEVLQARHIAEANDEAMTRMEAAMHASESSARDALRQLKPRLPASGGARLVDASAALDRFIATNQEIVALSRRNSNVRSLALTLGRKRIVAAEAEDQLRALDAEVAGHAFKATR